MSFRPLVVSIVACLLASGCVDQTSDTAAVQTDRQQSDNQQSQSRLSTLNPAETVSTMLDAYLHKRLGEYYEFVSAPDREVKSLDSLQAEFAPTAADYVTDFLFSSTRFNVDSVHVNGDSARVYVTSSSPPIGYVMREAQVVENSLGPETDGSTKVSVLTERHRLAGSPREENQSVYRLINEERGWRVVVGWAELVAMLDAEIERREGVDGQ